ncbi:metal ABC transporter substrate-binding protein [Halorussus amylolyticus]|uniref:metal ABC transporter substrate-binding protein n=1 Tax=Halorussus amylolyticus TaxID=1126242 RepID=UPI0010500F5D|nr:metal ABC transporter substrate-binding protein [Halorussus amylolyticus]
MVQHTRRRVLGTVASALAAGSLAGCVGESVSSVAGGGDSEDGDATAQASFFVFGDFASAVAGDAATAETLVPVGQHGHGWEPGPKIQGDVLESDLFVHVFEGFQPWADDIVTNLREDDAETAVVTAGAGVDLLDDGHDHGGEDDHDEEGNHDDEHHDEDETESHDDEHHDENETESHDDEHHDEDEDEDDHEHDEDGEDHDDHAGKDPHFWLDPMRAAQAVENIRKGFADIDPDNADAYADNAAAYESRLDDLHEEFESALDGASKDVVLVAGHDAFGYLADRYGFEVEALTGVSPDDQPTPRDIEDAQHIIEEHGIEYVVADPLESQSAANQLVEETDATEVLPMTSIPGRIDEWTDEGWGYVEVMQEINLPTLKTALGAE